MATVEIVFGLEVCDLQLQAIDLCLQQPSVLFVMLPCIAIAKRKVCIRASCDSHIFSMMPASSVVVI
jgi:hypothetical protein